MTNQTKAIVLLVLALVAAVLVVVVVAGGDDGGDDHDDQAAQEVFTEPASYAADPYTAPVTTEEPPEAPATTVAPKGSTTTPAATAAPGTATVSSSRGGEPGLYGGTKDSASCDKEKLISFLEDNPSKGRAWAEVVGISPSEIRTFVDKLTPVLLREDTRVTNHGYKNGRATSLQVVLQKRTAVLVDEYGRPVVKCYCGNPLTSPRPVQARYYGPRWDDFEPTRITVVVQNTTIINNFTLIDVNTGDPFGRVAGSSDDDGPPPKKDTTSSSQPPTSTTEAEGTTTTAAPDEPMITSEQLSGSWEFNADVAPGQPSTCAAYQGSFDMAVSGSGGTRSFTWTFFGTQAPVEPVPGTVEPDNSFRIENDLNGTHEVITGNFLLEPPDLVFMSGKSTITGDGGIACEFTFGGSKQ